MRNQWLGGQLIFFCDKILFLILSLFLFSCLGTQEDLVRWEKKRSKIQIDKIIENFIGEGNQPETYQTLYINIIQNNNNQSLLESRLKQKLKFAFNSDGRVQIVSKKKKAQILFYGKIINYQKIPLRFDLFNRVTAFRLGILMRIRITLNSNTNSEINKPEKILIKKEIRFDTNYSPLELPFEIESLANERLMDGLTNRVVHTSIEGWYSRLKRPDELNYEKSGNLLNRQ